MRNVYPNSYEWVLRVNSFVLPSYVAMSIYPSTMMIVNKNKLDETQLVSMVGSSSMGRSDGKATRNNLVSMMSNREALHLFALHLSREYSLEILLALIEFSQYLEYVREISNITSSDCH
eukprot:180145_1